jgi:hypothetical protein
MAVGHRLTLAAFLMLASAEARAQLAGDISTGQYGLTAGTAPSIGLNLSLGVQEVLATSVSGPGGTVVQSSGSLNTFFVPVVSLWWVSPWTLLGGNFGMQLSMMGSSVRTDYPRLDSSSATFGFGDLWLEPFGLSWHVPVADVVAGFALYLPTGRYSPGASTNTGLGQWGYEFSAGTTLWFDSGHHVNFATMAVFDLYSPKAGAVGLDGTQLHTGDVLSLQGAIGYQFLDGALNIGIPYSFLWKVTEDTLPPGIFPEEILTRLAAAKAWSGAIGLEVDYFWSASDGVVLRWVQVLGGINTALGPSFFLTYSHQFTFGNTQPSGSTQ